MAPLSQHAFLPGISSIFGTMALGLGVNALLRPRSAFGLFEFPLPASTVDQSVIDSLMLIYGIRDVFMGLSIQAACYFGSKKTLGCLLILSSQVAFWDGVVIKAQLGRGEWNHWWLAPLMGLAGATLLGAFDRF